MSHQLVWVCVLNFKTKKILPTKSLSECSQAFLITLVLNKPVMKFSKQKRMNWIFVVSAATAILAIVSAYLQQKEKLDGSAESLKKEQELNEAHKKLQEKSDTIIDTQNKLINLSSKLNEANQTAIKYQKEQNQALKDKSDLEMQANFNHVKKTLSDLSNDRPPKRITDFTEDEKINFILLVHTSLASEITNQYLINHPKFFNEWLWFYQQTSLELKTFPAGRVITNIGKNGEETILSPEELKNYNQKAFETYMTSYFEFQIKMMQYTKGFWM